MGLAIASAATLLPLLAAAAAQYMAPPPPHLTLSFHDNTTTSVLRFRSNSFISPSMSYLNITATAFLLLFLLLLRRLLSKPAVYLVDFCCYKPEDEQLKCSYEALEYATRINAHRFTLPSMDFLRKIFERSGLGEETYLPPCFRYSPDSTPCFSDAMAEAEDVMFTSVRHLLQITGVPASDISVLVTNCSLHWPSPSYASMIVNKFKLPHDCKTFHLAGMGCSASVIAFKLAADLLRVSASRSRRPRYALVVSTENITHNYYYGNNKPMLVTNCLFRVGGAAALLAAGGDVERRSKYRILHAIRTHECSDEAYECAYQREDEQGKLGISLNKNLMRVAGETLTKNIRRLAPKILPADEAARYVYRCVVAEVGRRWAAYGGGGGPKWAAGKVASRPIVPDFGRAIDHFCIHSGGRAVIDAVQSNLGLEDASVEPSRATLHRWGNTSSSSLWYMLAYLECKGRIKAGHKVWMLGLGAGFKCNSAIFLSLFDSHAHSKDSQAAHPDKVHNHNFFVNGNLHNPWNDCIHHYPATLFRQINTLPYPSSF